jgi:ubiquinone/menaquinone biosynthesis C-methylase UbiE
MTSYAGRLAELYDLLYEDKPYAAEAAFVHECLQSYSPEAPSSLLELACGTGEHALALEKFGYSILATDYSEDMLILASAKAKKGGSTVDFRVQDMRALNIPEAPFDAVFCLFDSIGYVETNEALEQVFRGVHAHLKPGGLFIFEFWHAAAMLKSYDPTRMLQKQTPSGDLIRISETTLDVEKQLARVVYTIYEMPEEGGHHKIQEVHQNRYFLVQEMAAWLARFDFKSLKWFAGFKPDEKIDAATWHILAVTQKTP